MKLVSVIIPCYLDSHTLGRAIESVNSQTYPNIEIIVVNDCSPESEQIEACLSQYPQVRYFRNPINVGLAATRNNGLAMARGEIVALLDADDEYIAEKISLQVEALEPNTVVTCGLVYKYPNGRLEVRSRPSCLIESATELQYKNTLNGAGLMASKSLLLQHGGYDPTLRSCEDFDLWFRLLSSGIRVRDIGVPLYIYYHNPSGLSKNFRNISKWEIEVIERYAVRMGAEWCSTPKYASVIAVWLLRHLMRSELINDEELRRQVIRKIPLLDAFPFFQFCFRLITFSRVLSLPALLIRWQSGPRSCTN
ncbi:MAG: glycosyltransferase family 2 protein [Rhodoferax sp.]|nr:glycosyltransferase family 2 protein [Rhodoferax sp.]MDP3651353.1 glycosyltransferase family 2 protein [Rhodoferax sp.]